MADRTSVHAANRRKLRAFSIGQPGVVADRSCEVADKRLRYAQQLVGQLSWGTNLVLGNRSTRVEGQ